MTRANKRFWKEFIDRLAGPEGCNFREKVPGDSATSTWECKGGNDQTLARKLLEQMGLNPGEVTETLAYCTANGGHCDCEIVFNVSPS